MRNSTVKKLLSFSIRPYWLLLILLPFMLVVLTGIFPSARPSTAQAAPTTYLSNNNEICNDLIPTTSIMPLGDSITQGASSGVTEESLMLGYRKDLWDSLIDNDYNVDFVGSNLNGQDYLDFDPDHEGEAGVTDSWVANRVNGFLTDNPADVVLLHIGTNMVNTNPESPANVEKILDEIDIYEKDNNRAVTVILARIINRKPYHSLTTDYNDNVAAMAQARIDNGDKIILVDMENGAGIIYEFQPAGDMWDDLHPYTTGYAKMAAVWYSALESILPQCNQVFLPITTNGT